MSVLMKKMQRFDPTRKNEPMKWYGVQKRLTKMDENEVAELVAEETTLNPAEALMAIRQLRKVLLRALMDGKSVQLGNWGSFNLRVGTSGTDTREALTSAQVKNVRICFRPGSEVKEALRRTDFVWVDSFLKERGE